MERKVSEQWRKSTYSQSNGGSCVEVGHGQGKILVRDTTQAGEANRTTMPTTARAWQTFVNDLK